jgi:hypothetical protein
MKRQCAFWSIGVVGLTGLFVCGSSYAASPHGKHRAVIIVVAAKEDTGLWGSNFYLPSWLSNENFIIEKGDVGVESN